jgi:hypothetical protein
MKNSLFKVILALNISLIFSSSVIADEPSEEEVVVDEITVLGIKASLKDA